MALCWKNLEEEASSFSWEEAEVDKFLLVLQPHVSEEEVEGWECALAVGVLEVAVFFQEGEEDYSSGEAAIF